MIRVVLGEARAISDAEVKRSAKNQGSRFPFAITTNLLFLALCPSRSPTLDHDHNNRLPQRRLSEVRRLNITESRPSIRANMAQPDISSILAALGKCAHALNDMRPARLTQFHSSTEPGCDPEQRDTTTSSSESATACCLPRRAVCAASQCPSLGRIPSPAHEQWQLRSSWHQANWQWCRQHCRGNCQGKEHCSKQGCAVVRS